jgi:tetratricopeptide (TPR) repeat protein
MAITTGTLTRRLVFLGVIFFHCMALASAQIAGGLTDTTNIRHGGNNYIVGTVYSPEGLPVTTKMRLRLTSPNWGDTLAMTDDRGRFVFSNVGSGVYTVIIDDEDQYLPVRQEVEIIRARAPVPETYTVTIRLRAKENNKPKTSPAVISASNAGVPRRALEFYQQASKLAGEKDYRGAIKQLELAVAEYPKFINALNQIGVLYLRLNELEEADKALKAALKIDPEAYDPLINRSIALFRMSRFKDAETVLRDTLKIKPDSDVAHYYLGRTLVKLDRTAEAEPELLACTKMSPGEFKEAHRVLAAIYLDRGAPQLVIEQLETYLKLVPTTPDADLLRKVIEQSKRSLSAAEPTPKP